MPPIDPIPVVWDDVEYPSIHAAARATGRQPASMWYLIQRGYRGEGDLKKPRTGMFWEGVWYDTVADAARAAGVPESTMRYRRDQRICYEEQIHKPYLRGYQDGN